MDPARLCQIVTGLALREVENFALKTDILYIMSSTILQFQDADDSMSRQVQVEVTVSQHPWQRDNP